jgi:glycopeptide antibiotics resistance protein
LYKKIILKSLKILEWLAFIAYLIVLVKVVILKNGLALTLAKHAEQYPTTWNQKIATINLTPFKTIIYYLSGNLNFKTAIENLLGNILAFCPMGFLLPLLSNYFKKMRYVLFISLLVSLLIEAIQLIFSVGSCDVDDIILNVLGAVLGFAGYKVLKYVFIKN